MMDVGTGESFALGVGASFSLVAGLVLVTFGAARITNKKPSGFFMFVPGGVLVGAGVAIFCQERFQLPLTLSIVIGVVAGFVSLGGFYQYMYNHKDRP